LIYSVAEDGKGLTRYVSQWAPRELEIEGFIVNSSHDGGSDELLNQSIFGEDLLIVSNQVVTTDKKRTDIVALDRRGNSVFIELKRDHASAGVETQALQYLASFAPWKGVDFIRRFRKSNGLEERVRGFLGDVPLEDVNRRQRIILIARSFDRSLFSMGKWFGNNGVSFRCMTYTPIEIQAERFISFSVAFDHSPAEVFPLAFASAVREPATFWHNIGAADRAWWKYLRDKGEIPASWENQPGDDGELLLKSYRRGDRIVAYAKGYGAVGWGTIQQPTYRLVRAGSEDDRRGGELRHRLAINWDATANRLEDGMPPAEIRTNSIESNKAQRFLEALSARFR
jgi:hypothetical protein